MFMHTVVLLSTLLVVEVVGIALLVVYKPV